MGQFATVAEVLQAVDEGRTLTSFFAKFTDGNNESQGTWYSFWAGSGLPIAGSAPATTPGTAYTNAAGSINFPDQSGMQKHIVEVETAWHRVDAQHNNVGLGSYGTIMIYDRLVGVGGLVTDSIGDVTVNSTALPRYTDGVGVQAWAEGVTQGANIASSLALSSYTNDLGNTGQIGPTFLMPGRISPKISVMLPILPGDRGVQAVSTIAVGTNAQTGAVFNLVLLKPLMYITAVGVSSNTRKMLLDVLTLPRIYDGASLGIMVIQPEGNTAQSPRGHITVAYK